MRTTLKLAIATLAITTSVHAFNFSPDEHLGSRMRKPASTEQVAETAQYEVVKFEKATNKADLNQKIETLTIEIDRIQVEVSSLASSDDAGKVDKLMVLESNRSNLLTVLAQYKADLLIPDFNIDEADKAKIDESLDKMIDQATKLQLAIVEAGKTKRVEEVAQTTEEVAQTTEEVAQTTEEVAQTTEEVAQTTEEVAQTTEEVAQKTEEIRQPSADGQIVIDETSQVQDEDENQDFSVMIEELLQKHESIQEKIQVLSEDSKITLDAKIKKIEELKLELSELENEVADIRATLEEEAMGGAEVAKLLANYDELSELIIALKDDLAKIDQDATLQIADNKQLEELLISNCMKDREIKKHNESLSTLQAQLDKVTSEMKELKDKDEKVAKNKDDEDKKSDKDEDKETEKEKKDRLFAEWKDEFMEKLIFKDKFDQLFGNNNQQQQQQAMVMPQMWGQNWGMPGAIDYARFSPFYGLNNAGTSMSDLLSFGSQFSLDRVLNNGQGVTINNYNSPMSYSNAPSFLNNAAATRNPAEAFMGMPQTNGTNSLVPGGLNNFLGNRAGIVNGSSFIK